MDPASNPTAWEKNRRVEFKIIYRKGEDLGQTLGCEAAEKANIKAKVPALKDVVKDGSKKQVKQLKPTQPAEAAKPAEATESTEAPKAAEPLKPAQAPTQ